MKNSLQEQNNQRINNIANVIKSLTPPKKDQWVIRSSDPKLNGKTWKQYVLDNKINLIDVGMANQLIKKGVKTNTSQSPTKKTVTTGSTISQPTVTTGATSGNTSTVQEQLFRMKELITLIEQYPNPTNTTPTSDPSSTSYMVYSRSLKKKVGMISKKNGFIPDRDFTTRFPADKRGLKRNGDLYVVGSKKGIQGGGGQYYY